MELELLQLQQQVFQLQLVVAVQVNQLHQQTERLKETIQYFQQSHLPVVDQEEMMMYHCALLQIVVDQVVELAVELPLKMLKEKGTHLLYLLHKVIQVRMLKQQMHPQQTQVVEVVEQQLQAKVQDLVELLLVLLMVELVQQQVFQEVQQFMLAVVAVVLLVVVDQVEVVEHPLVQQEMEIQEQLTLVVEVVVDLDILTEVVMVALV
tara:strand:- start:82 stop:702 length:621 start_codon:yes stop_codon:yes gene_type:complete